jgi:hypothetical protein
MRKNTNEKTSAFNLPKAGDYQHLCRVGGHPPRSTPDRKEAESDLITAITIVATIITNTLSPIGGTPTMDTATMPTVTPGQLMMGAIRKIWTKAAVTGSMGRERWMAI